MTNDTSNTRRHELLTRLTQMAVEEEDEEVSAWCKEQSERILRSLGKIDVAEIPWLVELGLARGGEFLRDVYVCSLAAKFLSFAHDAGASIFPQLQAQTLDKTFWIPFLQGLQQKMTAHPTTAPQVVSGLVTQCVAETVRNLPAFPTKPRQTYGYNYGAAQHEKDSEAITEVVKLCLETKNEALPRSSTKCGAQRLSGRLRPPSRRGCITPNCSRL
jgi:hypothetical protein